MEPASPKKWRVPCPCFSGGWPHAETQAELKLLASLQAFAAPAMSELTASYARP